MLRMTWVNVGAHVLMNGNNFIAPHCVYWRSGSRDAGNWVWLWPGCRRGVGFAEINVCDCMILYALYILGEANILNMLNINVV